MMNKRREFISAFKITKMIIFEVEYYTLSNNSNPYFTTSAMHFTRNKKSFTTCGQCQDDILPKGLARDFYKKWDKKHLLDLNDSEYTELMKDIEDLKKRVSKYLH